MDDENDVIPLSKAINIDSIEDLDVVLGKVLDGAAYQVYIPGAMVLTLALLEFILDPGTSLLVRSLLLIVALFSVMFLVSEYYDEVAADMEYSFKKRMYKRLLYRKSTNTVFEPNNDLHVPLIPGQIKWLVSYRFREAKKKFMGLFWVNGL